MQSHLMPHDEMTERIVIHFVFNEKQFVYLVSYVNKWKWILFKRYTHSFCYSLDLSLVEKYL